MRKLSGILIALLILSSSFIIPFAHAPKKIKEPKYDTIDSIILDAKYYLRGDIANVNITGSSNQDFTLSILNESGALIWSNNYRLDKDGFISLNLTISLNMDYGYYSIVASDVDSSSKSMFTVLKVDGFSSVNFPLEKTHHNINYTLFANATLLAKQGGGELRFTMPILAISWDSINTYQNSMMFLARFRKANLSIDISLALIHSSLKMIINGSRDTTNEFTFNVRPEKIINILHGWKSRPGNIVFDYDDLFRTKQSFSYNKFTGELKVNIPQTFSVDPEIFADGFECATYAPCGWTAENTTLIAPVISTDTSREGTNSSKHVAIAQQGNSDVYRTFIAEDVFYGRFYFNFSAFPQDDGERWDFVEIDSTVTAGSLVVGLENNSGTLNWYRAYHEDGGFTEANPAILGTLNTNTWHCLEVYREKGSGADGAVSLWLDDGFEWVAPALDMDGDGGSVRLSLGITGMNDAGTLTWYVDSVVADNSSRVGCISNIVYLTSLFFSGISSIDVNGTQTANLTETAFNVSEIAIGLANAESGFSFLYWDNENVSHIHDIAVTKTMTANTTITAYSIAVGGGGVAGVSMLLIAVIGGFVAIVILVASRKR